MGLDEKKAQQVYTSGPLDQLKNMNLKYFQVSLLKLQKSLEICLEKIVKLNNLIVKDKCFKLQLSV